MENSKITVGAKKASGLRLSHLLSFSKPQLSIEKSVRVKTTLLFTKIDLWQWCTQHANVAWGDRSSSQPQQGGETWRIFVNPAGKFWEQTSRWSQAKEETVY